MKIIEIPITPDREYNEIINAGVMFEHNAAKLVFELDMAYVGQNYSFYLEFATPSGVLRTEYLDYDMNYDISYILPNTVTSQMAVLCYFNIIKITIKR